jgi:hypothetical protein
MSRGNINFPQYIWQIQIKTPSLTCAVTYGVKSFSREQAVKAMTDFGNKFLGSIEIVNVSYPTLLEEGSFLKWHQAEINTPLPLYKNIDTHIFLVL